MTVVLSKRATQLKGSTKRVEIEWVDSASDGGWHEEDDILTKHEGEDTTLCLSLGYVIHEDVEKVTLAASLATNARRRLVGDVMSIPKVAIVKRRELK